MALASVICQMFVCVVPLSQPSSRDLDYPFWDDHVSIHDDETYFVFCIKRQSVKRFEISYITEYIYAIMNDDVFLSCITSLCTMPCSYHALRHSYHALRHYAQ